MLYVLLKAAHLVTLFVWIGGMVAVALALRHPGSTQMGALKAYDRAITTPAMILALLFGIALGVLGGWFEQTWLGLKILGVLALSGVHGALVGTLRRAITDVAYDPTPRARLFLPIGLGLLTLTVLIVTIKP